MLLNLAKKLPTNVREPPGRLRQLPHQAREAVGPKIQFPELPGLTANTKPPDPSKRLADPVREDLYPVWVLPPTIRELHPVRELLCKQSTPESPNPVRDQPGHILDPGVSGPCLGRRFPMSFFTAWAQTGCGQGRWPNSCYFDARACDKVRTQVVTLGISGPGPRAPATRGTMLFNRATHLEFTPLVEADPR